jgi:hypothetical protein
MRAVPCRIGRSTTSGGHSRRTWPPLPVHVTEKALNHVSGTTGGIVAVYQRHTYQDEIRAALRTTAATTIWLLTRTGRLPLAALQNDLQHEKPLGI